MMASEPGTSVKRADLEWRGVGWLLVLLRDMPDLLDREAEEGLRETVATFGLVAPDGSLTERGEEARRAALRLLAERQVSPARFDALAGGDVARWAALADAADAGPWEAYEKGEDDGLTVVVITADGEIVCRGLGSNMALIAAARTAVPALCAEVARLRAVVEAYQREDGTIAPSPPPAPDGLTVEQREHVGYVAALVQASSFTCITGRPEDAARAFGALLGCAGESEDGRRGAARALMHTALSLLRQPVPDINAEVVLAQLDADVKHKPRDAWDKGYSSGMARAVYALAPYLPVVPRSVR